MREICHQLALLVDTSPRLTANSPPLVALTYRPTTDGQKLAALANARLSFSSSRAVGKTSTEDTDPIGQLHVSLLCALAHLLIGATGTSCLPSTCGLATGSGVIVDSVMLMATKSARGEAIRTTET